MKHDIKNVLGIAIICLSGICLCCCGRAKQYTTYTGVVWNTTFKIIYSSDKNLDDSVRTVMRDVELSLSPFNKSSLITKINSDDSVPVDPFVEKVFDASLMINRQSGGVFDPTLSPLINAYGFGYRNSGSKALPDQKTIDSAMALVGIADCRIEDGKMIKKHPSTEFNFSAITKGFGVDCVGEMLERNGVVDYLVEIGGEIRVSGRNPDRKLWRIQIDAPVDNGGGPVHEQLLAEELTDICIATSGNYRNYKTAEDGRKYGHTISPMTGKPIQGKYVSVSVFASSCMVADGWATALMAGADASMLPPGVSAVTVEDVDGDFVVTRHNF